MDRISIIKCCDIIGSKYQARFLILTEIKEKIKSNSLPSNLKTLEEK